MQWTLNLAENGWLPDPAVKAGIRRLLRGRISSIRSDPHGIAELTRQMRASPIALATDAANDQHYELPPRFFELALGRHLKYSGCYWPAGTESLDAAEAAALEQTCRRAGIRDGMRILDLGCGWGSLSLWIGERYPNCRITSVSNSAGQGDFIRERALERGIRNLEVLTADMNAFQAARTFDRIVSVEMFEHMRNYEVLLARLAGWLEPDGRLFVHVFCHREHPYFFEDEGAGDWMARHFFTGGLMPSERLMEEFSGPLRLAERWRVNGRHYRKTALAWLGNIDRNREEILAIFTATYGPADATRWFHRWRMFFLACAELFGFNDGEEWFVSHSLWSPAESTRNVH
ncbi:MAG: cyclopropane-fatty-acyl-phospholipid synthase family protein [Acidobacteriota bacterium]|nr:cyclopropane-fatty-acyl-phospholipid synthase family protein [Acidobacteriota bacterium]